MRRHQLRRVRRREQRRALRPAFCVDERHRNPHKFDFAMQRHRGLPQVAAMRALRVKQHIHRVGAHHRAHGEAFGVCGDGFVRLGWLGSFACAFVGRVLWRAGGQGQGQGSEEKEEQLG